MELGTLFGAVLFLAVVGVGLGYLGVINIVGITPAAVGKLPGPAATAIPGTTYIPSAVPSVVPFQTNLEYDLGAVDGLTGTYVNASFYTRINSGAPLTSAVSGATGLDSAAVKIANINGGETVSAVVYGAAPNYLPSNTLYFSDAPSQTSTQLTLGAKINRVLAQIYAASNATLTAYKPTGVLPLNNATNVTLIPGSPVQALEMYMTANSAAARYGNPTFAIFYNTSAISSVSVAQVGGVVIAPLGVKPARLLAAHVSPYTVALYPASETALDNFAGHTVTTGKYAVTITAAGGFTGVTPIYIRGVSKQPYVCTLANGAVNGKCTAPSGGATYNIGDLVPDQYEMQLSGGTLIPNQSEDTAETVIYGQV